MDGDLLDYIAKTKQFSESKAAMLTKQIILALNYMLERKVVHRNIKPENILMSYDEETLKVADFGFSSFFEQHKRRKTSLGSALCMAPELANK